jgi:hypothetical protein
LGDQHSEIVVVRMIGGDDIDTIHSVINNCA